MSPDQTPIIPTAASDAAAALPARQAAEAAAAALNAAALVPPVVATPDVDYDLTEAQQVSKADAVEEVVAESE